MPSTISCSYKSELTTVITFTGDYVGTDDTATIDGMDATATYTASTSVPVTKVASGTVTLSSGTGSIDLTSLTGLTADEVVTMLGLKPQFVKLRNKSTNANVITIAEGASNGHALLGASFSFKLLPGQEALFNLNEAAPDVASGDRIWDITGTGSQVLEYTIVGG